MANINQPVTLTATLTPASVFATAATGTVTFFQNGTIQIGSPVAIANNTASTTATYGPAAQTVPITAVYSGDYNYSTSTAPSISLAVTSAPTFSVATANNYISLTSGATTGNTDAITLTSINSFAGAVALTCTISNGSGNAAGTCSLSNPSPTLTAGGAASSLLTINTTPGTGGTLYVVVTGTAGTSVVSSPRISVTVTAPSFTISGTPFSSTSNLTAGSTTGNTSTVTITSQNTFTGTVSLTCATSGITSPSSCTVSPTSVTLASGGSATTLLTLTTVGESSTGLIDATITGMGTTNGASISTTAYGNVSAELVDAGFYFFDTTGPLNFTSGATSGNTETLSIIPDNGFTGQVALSCSISAGSAYFPPSCAISPTTANISAGGATAIVTISSITATAQNHPEHGFWTIGSTVLLATCVFLLPIRRRCFLSLLAGSLVVMGLTVLSGCGSSSTNAPATPKSSAGTYTVTVTGSGQSFGVPITPSPTATFTVTIN